VNSVGDAFAFPFRDPGWLGKIAIQALILIIPIVGLIATAGWMLMTFDNLRAGRQELAPAGFHLSRGIGLFGVWFLYSLVLSIPGDIFGGFSSVSQISSVTDPNHPFNNVHFYSPGSGLGLIADLFLDFLLPSIIVMTYHYGFAGGLNVPRVWQLATSNVSNSVIAGLLFFVAGIVGALGLIACCIGVFFTGAYAATVMVGIVTWFERAQAVPPTATPAI
jgi:Protein of unknown function (DUF4013)